jgi:uncharacterized protein YggE
MKALTIVFVILVINPALCFGQASGNIGYSQPGGRARAEQIESSKRSLSRDEAPPNGTMFVDASVLMNVRADEYVTVFGVTQEGASVTECMQKMDAAVRSFSGELKQLGIGADALFVDFVAQNKIYGFDIAGEIAREKVVGFELKKNISIHHKDYALLDKLVDAASHSQIFDLIKVDYIVKDTQAAQNRLMQEAARIIKQKVARHQRLLGIRLTPPAQVTIDRPGAYYPTEMYDAYTAYESEDVNAGTYRQKYIIQGARKSRTFFFNPLSAKDFDLVINPVVIEPMVQFTHYLKVKYEIEQPEKRTAGNRKTAKHKP